MARLKKKKVEVQKFGGVETLGDVSIENGGNARVKESSYDLKSLEVKSKTNLEDDTGEGSAAVIRCFEFGMNPIAFQQYQPTKQELFNSHHKGIEVALWKDGLKVMSDVNPRIVVDEQNMRYKIFVSAKPMKGHILTQVPQTLRELAYEDTPNG